MIPDYKDIAENLSWITAMYEALIQHEDFEEAERTKKIAVEYRAFALAFLAMSREVQELYWKQASVYVAKKIREMRRLVKEAQNG